MTTANDDEIDFDFSQLDDTSISENQKQNLIAYVKQLQNQKRSINDELNQFKLSTGSIITKFLTNHYSFFYFCFLHYFFLFN